MPKFILDSAGQVGMSFDDLSPIARGYIEAMFFISCSVTEWHSEESRERVREGQADGDLPADAGFSDLHPAALAEIIADCGTFHVKARDLLHAAYARGYTAEQAGRDLWFTRNRHGVGFWAREVLNEGHMGPSPGGLGDRLSKAARAMGEVNPWFSESDDESSPTGYGFVFHSM